MNRATVSIHTLVNQSKSEPIADNRLIIWLQIWCRSLLWGDLEVSGIGAGTGKADLLI